MELLLCQEWNLNTICYRQNDKELLQEPRKRHQNKRTDYYQHCITSLDPSFEVKHTFRSYQKASPHAATSTGANYFTLKR